MIESSSNNTIKRIRSLNTKKGRDENQAFIVEGEKFVSEITDEYEIESFVFSESFINGKNGHLDKYYQRALNITVKDFIFETLTDTKTPQGVLAVCKIKKYSLSDVMKNNSFLVMIEEISDPGNLGTVIRTADAFGVNGIILSKNCADIFNPKAVRSTAGSLFHVPLVTDCDLLQVMDVLKQKKICTLAAHLKGEKTPSEINLTRPCCILIGNEAHGLSEVLSSRCDCLVKIPMPGRAESLNAAIAAGVLMYEAIRQRLNIER